MNKLAYIKNGKTCYLPAWYLERSDDEIEEAKRILMGEPDPSPISNDSAVEPLLTIQEECKLRNDLEDEFAFSKVEIDEIIQMVYNGQTIDSAIQRQLMK